MRERERKFNSFTPQISSSLHSVLGFGINLHIFQSILLSYHFLFLSLFHFTSNEHFNARNRILSEKELFFCTLDFLPVLGIIIMRYQNDVSSSPSSSSSSSSFHLLARGERREAGVPPFRLYRILFQIKTIILI